MVKRVQLLRGTNSEAQAFLGEEGELQVNKTNKSIHVHDKSKTGGYEQARADLNNVAAATQSAAGKMTSGQVTQLDAATAKDAAQDSRLDAIETKNTAQDTAIGNNTTAIGANTTAIDANTASIAANAAAIAGINSASLKVFPYAGYVTLGNAGSPHTLDKATHDGKMILLDDAAGTVEVTIPPSNANGGMTVGFQRAKATVSHVCTVNVTGGDSIGVADVSRGINAYRDIVILNAEGANDRWWDVSRDRELLGATASTPGRRGAMPGAATGQQDFVLFGDKTWRDPATLFVPKYAQLIASRALPAAVEDEVTDFALLDYEEIKFHFFGISITGGGGAIALQFGDATDYTTGNDAEGAVFDESGVNGRDWAVASEIAIAAASGSATLHYGCATLTRIPDAMAVDVFGANMKAWQVDTHLVAKGSTTDRNWGSGFFATTKTVDRVKLLGATAFNAGKWGAQGR